MAAYDIITAAEFKTYFGVSSATNDTPIGTFISEASLEIEHLTGQKIVSQTVTDEVGNGDGSSRYYPKFAPVISVTTLQYRNSPSDSWATLEDTSANIFVDPDSGQYIELFSQGFPVGRSNIRVTYTSGYSVVPADIKRICYEMVAVRFRESNHSGFGENRLGVESQSSTQTGGSTSSKSYKDLRPEWEKVLRRYRRSVPQTYLMR